MDLSTMLILNLKFIVRAYYRRVSLKNTIQRCFLRITQRIINMKSIMYKKYRETLRLLILVIFPVWLNSWNANAEISRVQDSRIYRTQLIDSHWCCNLVAQLCRNKVIAYSSKTAMVMTTFFDCFARDDSARPQTAIILHWSKHQRTTRKWKSE